jgi:tetratricopeptide (TPR) repeat protein
MKILVAITAVLLLASVGFAQEVCLKECAGEVDCEVEVVDCLIAAGRTRDAVKHVKPLANQNPDQPAFARLLARAYLADKNPFWAQRTLQKAIARNERDCLSRTWLAWVHIKSGDLDLAQEALEAEGCPEKPADQARWRLLEAFLARTREDHHLAVLAVSEVPDSGEIYPEDRGLWLFLRGAEDPGWIQPLSFRLELSGGYTSNSKGGSPTDASGKGPDSGMARMDLFGRLVWPASRLLRPVLEVGLKGHGIATETEGARKLSYLEMHARPGFIFGTKFPRILLGYKVDYLVLNQDLEIQRRFYEANRGEIELETGSMTYFAGAGRRIYHYNGRTRFEIDGGLGGSFLLFGRARMLAAFSARYYDAIGDAYDQLGATGLLVSRIEMKWGLIARLGITIGTDYYLNSGGKPGDDAYGTPEERFDLLVKLSAGLWSPMWMGARAGLTYDFAYRDSTADESSNNYDYKEHRLLFKIRWSFDLNPWAPEVVEYKGHVPLDYGIGAQAGPGMEEERIQDLLRQDEAARRGSSCVD